MKKITELPEDAMVIDGTNGYYLVTKSGVIISKKYSDLRIMNQYTNNSGYKYVTFRINGRNKNFTIHRLVALTFIPNPNNKLEVNHINANKADNHIDNLEWCTSSENKKHAFKYGLRKPVRIVGSSNNSSKLTEEEVLKIRDLYSQNDTTLVKLGKMFGVGKSTIGYIVNRKNWTHI